MNAPSSPRGLGRQIRRIREIYHEYPSQFWLLVGGTFIDAVGGAVIFPFFTLYVTGRFNVGMSTVGLMFGGFSVATVFGSSLGGALADRLGRKWMVLFGLVASALSSLLMGYAGTIGAFLAAAIVAGLFANAGGPARQAMVADLLPAERHAEGYGVMRVVQNLAVVIGPAVGGLLATRSYLLLFYLDAVTSVAAGLILARYLRESKPAMEPGTPQESMLQTVGGYGRAFRDGLYMVFLVAIMLGMLVYVQMNGTLAVFLRDSHQVPVEDFGLLMSLNAAMVVALQFSITRRLRQAPPFLALAGGTLLYAVGFALYGLVSTYVYFALAMVVITLGEMLVVPVGQAVAAQLAPSDMRGRYMALFGFAHIIPSAVGLYLAGLIMDNVDPNLVWYAAGLVGLAAAGLFVAIHLMAPTVQGLRAQSPEPVMRQPEAGGADVA
jgi:MFS family permease